MSSRRGGSTSIDVSNEPDESEGEIDTLDNMYSKEPSFWSRGGEHRDHLIQVLLNKAENFGVYKANDEPGGEDVFYKSPDAGLEAENLNRFIIDHDDQIARDIAIHISKYNIMMKYMIPLFSLAIDDRTLARVLLKIFLNLTKPIDSTRRKSLESTIRPRKSSESKEEALARQNKEKDIQNNTYEQVTALLHFKECLLNDDVFRVILYHTNDALSSPPTNRTEEDLIIIESFLILMSHLLQISSGPLSPAEEVTKSKSLQIKLILLLKDDFLDIIQYLCVTVNEKENIKWRSFLIEIVTYLFRGRDMKDMIKLLKTKMHSNTFGETEQKKNPIDYRPRQKSNGLLQSCLQERENRLLLSNLSGSRINRFGGTIKVPGKIASVSVNSGTAAPSSVPLLIHNTHVLNGVKSSLRPAVQKRSRAVKTCTTQFLQVDTSNAAMMSLSDSKNDAQAVEILLNFMEIFMQKGFGEIIVSIKEDWRRNEEMTTAEELIYFEMLSKCLKYQGMKIMLEKSMRSEGDIATNGNDNGVTSSTSPWIPNMNNITNCFDRMCLLKPIDMILSIRDKKMPGSMMFIPMCLHKENLVILRLMLESENILHNDIALGILQRFFYITEKCDPLPQLLRDWTPGKFSRDHMQLLVELVHETMKLLDIADYCFRKEVEKEEEENSKLTKEEKKKVIKDGDRALFLATALKFDVNVYFSKLVGYGAHTVSFYIRALELYSDNSSQMNHYLYTFLQRLCSFRIESDVYVSNAMNANMTSSRGDVTLGHMLFNVKALIVFNKILNDKAIAKRSDMQALLRLIQGIVRRFLELSQKNKLLFVEALFSHSYPQAFWPRVEGVYNAMDYVKGVSQAHHRAEYERRKQELSDEEDEFDETSDLILKPGQKIVSPSKRKNHKDDKKSQKSSSKKHNNWTNEEIAVLTKLYAQYKGSSSIFDVIAQHPEFMELSNGKKSAKVIEKKATKLKLHLKTQSISDSDDSNSDREEDINPTKKIVSEKMSSLSTVDSSPELQREADKNVSGDLRNQNENVPFWDDDNEEEDDGKWSSINNSLKPSQSDKIVNDNAVVSSSSENQKRKHTDTAKPSKLLKRRSIEKSDSDTTGDEDDIVFDEPTSKRVSNFAVDNDDISKRRRNSSLMSKLVDSDEE